MGYERELEKEKYICKLNKLNAYQLIIEEDNLSKLVEQLINQNDFAEVQRQSAFLHLTRIHMRNRMFKN